MLRSSALFAAAGLAALGCATEARAPAKVVLPEPEARERPGPTDARAPDLETARDSREQRMLEGDRAFAARGDGKQPIEAAIAAWESAERLGPGADVEVRLARAEHFLAQIARRGEREAHYGRGADHALAAMRALGVEGAEGCADRAGAEAAAALYWRAENLEGRAREAGLVAGARDRRLALCLCRRAAQVAPDYFHAGPLRLLGKLLAATPILAGGSLEQSRRAFEQAIEKSPSFAPTRVEFARTWAVKAQDRKLFERSLDAAMAQSKDPPEVGPENALARERARALKLRMAELF